MEKLTSALCSLQVLGISLKSPQHITEALKDFFQRLVISFYMHNITPKDVLVKLLTCKHNCEKFLLYLCIPCLSLSKGSGCKSHWLLKLKKSSFQPCVRGVQPKRGVKSSQVQWLVQFVMSKAILCIKDGKHFGVMKVSCNVLYGRHGIILLENSLV